MYFDFRDNRNSNYKYFGLSGQETKIGLQGLENHVRTICTSDTRDIETKFGQQVLLTKGTEKPIQTIGTSVYRNKETKFGLQVLREIGTSDNWTIEIRTLCISDYRDKKTKCEQSGQATQTRTIVTSDYRDKETEFGLQVLRTIDTSVYWYFVIVYVLRMKLFFLIRTQFIRTRASFLHQCLI